MRTTTDSWRLHSLVADCVCMLDIGTASVRLHGGTAAASSTVGVLSGGC